MTRTGAKCTTCRISSHKDRSWAPACAPNRSFYSLFTIIVYSSSSLSLLGKRFSVYEANKLLWQAVTLFFIRGVFNQILCITIFFSCLQNPESMAIAAASRAAAPAGGKSLFQRAKKALFWYIHWLRSAAPPSQAF